jgi:hypothetical protein
VTKGTKNGKTLVWNNHPKRGDQATWSGSRDGDGYARGFGTLTWYTRETGASSAKPAPLYARYWGNMVRGKLNGPVNVHSKRKTFHAVFAECLRTTRWAAGTGPSGGPSRTHSEQFVEPPAEGPIERDSQPSVAPPPFADQADVEVDESLQLLVWPPRNLRLRPLPKGPPTGAGTEAASLPANVNARLTKEEVVDLADGAARSHGYDPADFEGSEPQYDPADQIWLLSYNQKATARKHFIVTVGDRSKRTAVVEDRIENKN